METDIELYTIWYLKLFKIKIHKIGPLLVGFCFFFIFLAFDYVW